MTVAGVFRDLGLRVLERGWLSSNVVVVADGGAPATVIDTGYDSHAAQTSALVASLLQGRAVGRVLNTHLHSDHCGGNAALQHAWGCEIWVPEPSIDAVRAWDESRLSFRATDQRCRRFSARSALAVGDVVRVGACDWRIVGSPGHDPDAVMLYQEESGVLITADALWEDRLAIVFPELDGLPGFDAARTALARIEELRPRIVIPGHGAPFTDVAGAIESSCSRIDRFEANPGLHDSYAARSLTMFHMLEIRSCDRSELIAWLQRLPALAGVFRRVAARDGSPEVAAAREVERLVAERHLRADGDRIVIVGAG